MSERLKHTFQFAAGAIADAAADEAAYHHARAEHWNGRASVALQRVKATISAKVVETEVTMGTSVSVVVDYGDKAAWNEYRLAHDKVEHHKQAAARYEVDQRVYGTQDRRVYDLDTDDVAHFRLGGQEREA